MKKELAAAALLLALVAGSLGNLAYLRRFIGGLEARLDDSRAACEAGDLDAAAERLRGAIEVWNGAEGYTHIFIRHAELDSAGDAFYELLSALLAGEQAGALGAYEKLSAHLQSLYTMERPSLGSIL